MIRQRLALVGGYPGGVWTCRSCSAELCDGVITHRDDCRFIGDIAEGPKLTALRAAVQRVLDDEESGEGGWGPDVTMVAVLRDAIEASTP